MSLWNKLFGSQDPMGKANPYIDQAIATQQPYSDQGQAAQARINPIYERYSTDPAGALDELLKKYQPSSDYQLKLDEGLKAAAGAAGAGGYRGGQQDLIKSSGLATRLMGDDMQQWLKNVYGIEKTGLEGEQKLADRGFDAATSIGNIRNQQGAMSWNAENTRNKGQSEFINQLLQLLAAGGGAAIGGMVGGVPGAYIGSQIGSKTF